MKTIEDYVKKVLLTNKEAQTNDMLLVFETLKLMGYITDKTTFKDMLTIKMMPSMHSITRIRRILQKQYPELRNEEIYQKRHSKQNEYIEYNRKTR